MCGLPPAARTSAAQCRQVPSKPLLFRAVPQKGSEETSHRVSLRNLTACQIPHTRDLDLPGIRVKVGHKVGHSCQVFDVDGHESLKREAQVQELI